ncbi:hypothetical protein H4R21_002209, partial [Coemansia helicoidea]
PLAQAGRQGRLVQVRKVALPHRAGHQKRPARRGGAPGRHRPQLRHARSVQRHRARRAPGMARVRPGHRARAGAQVPLQPVRRDKGRQPKGLPAARGRPHGAEPQPGKLLCRGRAGRVLPLAHGARHRAIARPHAPGPSVQLRRHPPPPPGRKLPPDPHQPSALGREQPPARRRHGHQRQRRRRAQLRAQLVWRTRPERPARPDPRPQLCRPGRGHAPHLRCHRRRLCPGRRPLQPVFRGAKDAPGHRHCRVAVADPRLYPEAPAQALLPRRQGLWPPRRSRAQGGRLQDL